MRFGPLIAVLVALACATSAQCSLGARGAVDSVQILPFFSAQPIPALLKPQAIQGLPKAGGFPKRRQSQTPATIAIFGDFEHGFCQAASELIAVQLRCHKSYLNVTYTWPEKQDSWWSA